MSIRLIFVLVIVSFIMSGNLYSSDLASLLGGVIEADKKSAPCGSARSGGSCGIDYDDMNMRVNSDKNCKLNSNDEFEIGAKVIFGPDAGKCLDTTATRPVIMISDQKLKKYNITKKPGHIYVANFRHNNKYYFAEIPIDSVEEQILQVEHFDIKGIPGVLKGAMSKITGHDQTRMTFTKPIKLRTQPSGKGKVIEVEDLILSAESVRPSVLSEDGKRQPAPYDSLGKGMDRNSYTNGYAMTSGDDKLKHFAKLEEKKVVEQLVLKRSKKDKKEFILDWIKESENTQISGPYDTKGKAGHHSITKLLQPSTTKRDANGTNAGIDNKTRFINSRNGQQCTSSQWLVMDRSDSVKARKAKTNGLDDSIPLNVRKSLKARGIEFKEIESYTDDPRFAKYRR